MEAPDNESIVLRRKLGIGSLKTKPIEHDDLLSPQVDNLLRRFLLREDRLSSNLVVSVLEGSGLKAVVEDGSQTNELVLQRKTTLLLREFSAFVEKVANTSNRVCPSDYLDIQFALKKHNKSICYYVVYSETDRKFRDIIAVSINLSTLAYLSSQAST